MAVQTTFRQGRVSCSMLPHTLAELGWTWLVGCITFPLLTLAIHGSYQLIAFIWSMF